MPHVSPTISRTNSSRATFFPISRAADRATATLCATALCVGLAACGGGHDPAPTPSNPPSPPDSFTPTPNPTGGTYNQNSRGFLAFPQIAQARGILQCDRSATNPLVGCYVAESCDPNDEGEDESFLYLLDITNEGTLEGHLLLYTTSAACQGGFIPVGMSALNLRNVVTGTPFTGVNGVNITPIDATHTIPIFPIDYISSLHLEQERLCFAEGDFGWPESATLWFQHKAGEERPTTIDFSSCLLRLN